MVSIVADSRITVTDEGGIAVITIARPEKLNALDFEMILALEQAARAIDADPALRVAIITGAGEKSFCAGGDIAAWSQVALEEFALSWVRAGHRAFDALARMRQPLIAALNGHALGGGFEVAACADFRIAEEHVTLGLPETSIGIIPGWSGTQRAVRRFGAQAIRRMAIAGEVHSATAALEQGLVDKVVAKGHALAAAHDMAGQIMGRGKLATNLAKLMINAAEGEDAEAAIEAMGGGLAATSAELKAKVEAFRNRKPKG